MDILKKISKKIFQYEAKFILKKYNPKIIAIIGSVGKSSAKQAIYSVMSDNIFVRKSGKSLTTDLGVPLSIIGCPTENKTFLKWFIHFLFGLKIILLKNRYPQWLILEIDGDKPGDIESASKIIRPDILIITEISEVPSHIEMFNDLEHFISEKMNMVNSISDSGLIIYNKNDDISKKLAESSDCKKISYGILGGEDFSSSKYEILYGNSKNSNVPVGMSFEILNREEKVEIKVLDSIGNHIRYACIPAFIVATELKIPTNKIIQSLNQYKSLQGRMRIIPGIKNSTILDDSYNSSPTALKQSLSILKEINVSGRKIAVIGDMLELGKFSADEHRKIAEFIKLSADIAICVGLRSRITAEELLNIGFPDENIIQEDLSEKAGLELQKIIKEGDVILVKGSQLMRMEKIVEEVMRYPQDKTKILTRQEEKWS